MLVIIIFFFLFWFGAGELLGHLDFLLLLPFFLLFERSSFLNLLIASERFSNRFTQMTVSLP